MCMWSFSFSDHSLYNFENAYFEWKQKHAVLVHIIGGSRGLMDRESDVKPKDREFKSQVQQGL